MICDSIFAALYFVPKSFYELDLYTHNWKKVEFNFVVVFSDPINTYLSFVKTKASIFGEKLRHLHVFCERVY